MQLDRGGPQVRQEWRVGGRGGGGGSGGGVGERSKKRDIMDALLPDTAQILDKPQAAEGEDKVEISKVEYLGSYNWTNEQEPTIIVPGK